MFWYEAFQSKIPDFLATNRALAMAWPRRVARPLPPFEGVIKSEPLPGNHEFFAGLKPTPLLTTPATPAYNKISDEQLLDFFEGQAVALVRLPGGRTELEILDKSYSE